MSRPVAPIVQMRLCAAEDCDERYEHPHGGAWPNAFHSAECARRTARARTPRPRPRADLVTRAPKKRARAISVASPAQRAAIADSCCIVCGAPGCHPAHLIDKSLVEDVDGDPRAVVPLCPGHHRAYDEQGLSILNHLEPHGRAALAYAVERFGLISTLERVTNERWAPVAPRAAC